MAEPVQWGDGRKADFILYIVQEMQRALGNRTELEQTWRGYLEQYRAPFTDELKRFPYEGASAYTMPVTAMNADPLIAQFMTTLHTPDNLWTLQPMNERWVPIAKPMQDYLEYLDQTRLHMFDVNYRAILEFIKLGTCIYEHGWSFERRSAMRMLPDGSVSRTQEMVSGPFVDHVSLVDFLIPPEALHIQADLPFGASWVAKRFYLREAQLMARAKGQAPFLPDYDPAETELVRHFVNNLTVGNTVQDEKFELDKYSPSYLRRIELWEVHARFDTTGTGTVDDVVAVIHLPSRRLLRAILNPYAHNSRPFSVARYFRGDGFYGIGECEQSNIFQRIISELTNANIDNVRLTNAPMLGVKAGANVVPGEPIYLLKMFLLDNPQTDIKEVRFTSPYPSLQQLAPIFEQWHERRTGVSDLQRGNTSELPSRTPATSLLSIMQEGKRRLDLSLKDLRICLNEVGQRVLQNCQQFMSNVDRNPESPTQLKMVIQALGQPEGTYVAMQLGLPLDDIGSGLGVAVTATSGTINKEVEKQNFLALVQLQTQLGQQYIQLASIFSNPQILQTAPQVAQVAQDVFKGFRELQTRLLEQFDVRNPEDLLPSAAVLMDGQAGLGAGAGAFGGPGAASPVVPGAGAGPIPAQILAGLLGAPSGLGGPR